LRLLILVAREGFLKDKCGPRAKKFEHHCFRSNPSQERPLSQQSNTNALSPLQTRPYYSLRSLWNFKILKLYSHNIEESLSRFITFSTLTLENRAESSVSQVSNTLFLSTQAQHDSSQCC